MKILKFQSQNVKKIKAIEIDPDPNAVLVTGKNEQGKSSILDSIWYALGGERALPAKPVREGEEKAEISLDLGEYLVERTIKSDGKSALRVFGKETETGDRPKFSKPQTILNKLVGGISFDPLAFEAMSKSERRTLLLSIAGLDLDEWDRENDEISTAVRDAKREFDRYSDLPSELPSLLNPEDASEIISEMKSALNLEHERGDKKARIKTIAQDEESLKRVLKKAKEKLAATELALTMQAEELRIAIADLEDLPLPIDGLALDERLAHANEHNEEVKRRSALHDRAADCAIRSNELGKAKEKLKEHRADRDMILAEASFPVEGLSIDESGVIFEGLPFEQASASERLRISLKIAAELNPTLRVILVPERARLDADALSGMIAWSKENDYQLWIERVEDSPGEGLFIEDGGIIAIDGKEITT